MTLLQTGYRGLDRCYPKTHVLKAWPPACVTIGWGGTFEGMDQQEKIRSLSGTPAPLLSLPCFPASFCHAYLPRCAVDLKSQAWLIVDGNCEVRLIMDRNLGSCEVKQTLCHCHQSPLVFEIVLGNCLTQQEFCPGHTDPTWWLPWWTRKCLLSGHVDLGSIWPCSGGRRPWN